MQSEKHSNLTFSERTDALAAALRVSLRDLADYIGVSQAMLFAYRTNRNPITPKAWRKLELAEDRAFKSERYDLDREASSEAAGSKTVVKVIYANGSEENISLAVLPVRQLYRFCDYLADGSSPELVALCVGRDLEWIDALSPEGFGNLLKACVDLNFPEAAKLAEVDPRVAAKLIAYAISPKELFPRLRAVEEKASAMIAKLRTSGDQNPETLKLLEQALGRVREIDSGLSQLKMLESRLRSLD